MNCPCLADGKEVSSDQDFASIRRRMGIMADTKEGKYLKTSKNDREAAF
jgi:hypothetical protein